MQILTLQVAANIGFTRLVTAMTVLGVVALTVSACSSPPSASTAGGAAGAVSSSNAESPSTASSTADASPPPASSAPASALACVPGDWAAEMPGFVKVFQTPGKPEYVAGSYTFTFADDFTFTGSGNDVTFRLSIDDGFVDVHNSWTEDGLWATATDSMTFNEVLTITGYPGKIDPDDLTLISGVPSTALVVLVGGGWIPGERFGMVNGSMRTPPLSDEGGPISAIGYVDCESDRMELWVEGSGWNGNFSLTRP